jgi:long-chain acyl-CoA synthetase
MPRRTLTDFFADLATHRTEFLSYDDGYRTRSHTYDEVARAARAFGARLQRAGLGKGDKVLIWSENRPEWIVALWGAILTGVIAVPLDYRASAEFLERVRRKVGARFVLVGQEVATPAQDVAKDWTVWKLAELDWNDAAAPETVPVEPDDIAEIIFTSGATAEPKGVVITHRNILANIVPIEREVVKYRAYGRPFFPLRFLNLLPLSHLFGQAMATFVPPMLPGVVVFMRSYNPSEIIKQIKKRRISVLVCVPKILDVLHEHLARTLPSVRAEPGRMGIARRWWHYRDAHRLFGWKFWSFVVGAAPLEPELEAFWSRLGFLVVQGYGLTETAPIVTLNHPFHARRGSVGKAIAGVETKIAPDGEILVRGDNVTRGYYEAEGEDARAFEDGWFHTGDIGEIDDNGQLFIRGRKKEMIVTPEGLNVFPEDVERVINQLAGVRDSAVVGKKSGGEERPYAVLVLERSTDAATVVNEANRQLEDHQRIRGFSAWPGTELPRTEGTRKLRRSAIRQWVETGERAAAPAGDSTFDAILAKYLAGRTVSPNTSLEELGLSSLERVELMVELEDRLQTSLDEGAFSDASSIDDLRSLIDRTREGEAAPTEPVTFPSWNRTAMARLVRNVSLATWILPLARVFAWIRVEGREHLSGVHGPVIFAANHQSHMDTPVILAALPSAYSYRVAPAMAKEFFKAHFFPEQYTTLAWFTNSLNYYLSALFFNAFPIPQREAGARQTLRYVGDLLSDGYSVLIFPEGRRTDKGEIRTFQPGIGMIASRLGVPVIPVRLEGVDRVLHHTWRMARPGRVRVAFGAPMSLTGDDYAALARQVELATKKL